RTHRSDPPRRGPAGRRRLAQARRVHARSRDREPLPGMTAADLVLHGARLLTLAPLKDERPRVGPAAGDVGAVMDGFVAVRDGAIVATGHGSVHSAIERGEGATDVDVEGRVVMPGFVDPHTHLCYAG